MLNDLLASIGQTFADLNFFVGDAFTSNARIDDAKNTSFCPHVIKNLGL